MRCGDFCTNFHQLTQICEIIFNETYGFCQRIRKAHFCTKCQNGERSIVSAGNTTTILSLRFRLVPTVQSPMVRCFACDNTLATLFVQVQPNCHDIMAWILLRLTNLHKILRNLLKKAWNEIKPQIEVEWTLKRMIHRWRRQLKLTAIKLKAVDRGGYTYFVKSSSQLKFITK